MKFIQKQINMVNILKLVALVFVLVAIPSITFADGSYYEDSWGYSDYPSYESDWGYSDYSSYDSDWGYSDYPSYESDWGYSDYSSYDSDWGYSDYSSFDDYSYREYEITDTWEIYGGDSYYGYSGGYSYPSFSIYRDYGRGCGSSCNSGDYSYKYTDKSKTIYNYNDSSINDSYNSIVYRDYNNDDDDDDYDNDDLDVVCRVSDTSIEEGDRITIEADVDGGDSPYEYDWSGDIDDIDDFEDDERRQTVEIEDEGRYDIRVRVEDDDGNVAYDDCPVIDVDNDNDDDDDDDDSNVNIYGSSNNPYYGTPASLSSVYLSQVPYTGASDWALFIGLISAAALIALYSTKKILKNRELKVRKQTINSFKQDNLARKGII